MILELIATGLLAYGVSTSIVNVNHGNNHDYHNESNEVGLVKTESYNASDGHSVFGLYNWKDEFSFSNTLSTALDFVLDSEHKKICSFTFNGNYNFLEKIQFVYSGTVSPGSPEICLLTFSYYDEDDNDYTKQLTVLNGDLLTANKFDGFRDLIFNVNVSLYLDTNQYQLWNYIFTTNDNQYVTSYDGYYNFLNVGSNVTAQFSVVGGSIVFNNQLTSGIQVSLGFSDYIYALQYDVSLNQSKFVTYGSSFFTNYNIYFSNVKMPVTAFNTLSNIGAFSYIRDTQYDDTDFHDLLFTIMDTPIYFFSRMFDFQFLGVNLYIALSGLITLAIVVIVIRKIW